MENMEEGKGGTSIENILHESIWISCWLTQMEKRELGCYLSIVNAQRHIFVIHSSPTRDFLFSSIEPADIKHSAALSITELKT